MRYEITVHEVRCASGYVTVEAETVDEAFKKAESMLCEDKIEFDDGAVFPSGDYEYEYTDDNGVTHVYAPSEMSGSGDASECPGYNKETLEQLRNLMRVFLNCAPHPYDEYFEDRLHEEEALETLQSAWEEIECLQFDE